MPVLMYGSERSDRNSVLLLFDGDQIKIKNVGKRLSMTLENEQRGSFRGDRSKRIKERDSQGVYVNGVAKVWRNMKRRNIGCVGEE